jgi:hypothetical protein
LTVREVESLVRTRFSKAARGGRADAAGRCSASTARDCCEHAIEFLDALNVLEFDPWTPVDAAWTPKQSVGVSPENENDG